MIELFHTVAIFFYVAASASLGAAFAGRSGWARAGLPLAAAGAAAHAAGITAYTRAFGELPLVGLAPSLSSIAFGITIFLLLIAVLTDSRSVALIILPIVAILLTASLLFGLSPAGRPMVFRGPWFTLHVIFAFAAYAGLTVAAAAGGLYLLQFRELKGKHLGRMFRFFPPLPTLDTISRAGLLVALPSLTVALVVGFGWSARFGQSPPREHAQVIWGVLTWITFVVILAARAPRLGGRERRGAAACVIGFVVILIAYVVLRMSPAAQGGFL